MSIEELRRGPHAGRPSGDGVEATEALADPDALLFDPDPKSRSGRGARLLGYSATAGTVLVVILVPYMGVAGGARTAGGRTPPTRGSTGKGTRYERHARERGRRGRRGGRRHHGRTDAGQCDRDQTEPIGARRGAADPAGRGPIEALAEHAGVPVSALLRTWITAGLAATRTGR